MNLFVTAAMATSPEPSEETLESEVVNLVKELTREVLTKGPQHIHHCCALYLERKLRQRDGKSTITSYLL